MKKPVIQFESKEPQASIDLAIVSLLTASQLLGDALRVEIDSLTREQLVDVLDMVDNSLEALRNIGI